VICRFATGRAARLWNWVTEFARDLDPFINDFFDILHGFGAGLPSAMQPGNSGTSTTKLSSSLLQ